MLIDEYLPQYDAVKRHCIEITAPAEKVYAAARALEVRSSPVIRGLFRLRGLPGQCLSLEGLLNTGFIILGEDPPRELLLGLVGRFWRFSGDLQLVQESQYREFNRPGYAKAAWNFSLDPVNEKVTRLSTETRVLCTDKKSRWKFRIYWTFIRPFSGLIRKEILRAIKRNVEL